MLSKGKKEQAQELKKQLLSFTTSAIFKNRRVKNDVERYSGVIYLEFDKLSDEQIGKLRSALPASKYSVENKQLYLAWECWIKPGGV